MSATCGLIQSSRATADHARSRVERLERESSQVLHRTREDPSQLIG